MSQMSNYLESGLLNWLFRSNTNNFVRPLTVAIALCSGVPDDASTGSTLPEVPNAGGYSRSNLGAPANSLFTEISQAFGVYSSGNISNAGTITFGPFSADVGYVSGIAITDSGVYGAGNVLLWGRLGTPRDVKQNDSLSFSANNLNFYFG